MEFTQALKILWSRKLITGAVLAVAILAALAVHASVSSVPTGAATVQLLVDSPDSALANLSQETQPLTERATVLAQVMTSADVLKEVATAAGVPVSQITAQGPYSGPGQVLDVITPAEARSNQLLAEHAKYRLTFIAQTDEPVVTASVQGPTAISAARVAAAIYPGRPELRDAPAAPVGHAAGALRDDPPARAALRRGSQLQHPQDADAGRLRRHPDPGTPR